ncbi:MAG: glycosyltransferase [Calditrichaeota bacterium]|nr:MAG: glycosyltransferase [Calditrichota bacterium]MBL1205295.1 glycosyltransferase [Calditrichota bacterium]NOG45124.1 glycosyltransferase [Calditrichota bacterium]
MNLKELTVIIPTKNEEKNIISFLDSLPKHLKLLVVDSSTDRTRELIQIQRPQNTEVFFEECNIPRARQIGADNASTEWLLYSDCDMIFDKMYFENLEKMEIREKLGEIMGGKHSLKKYKWYYRFYSFNMMFFSWFTIPVGSGSNMILRKKALQQIGGFDFSLSHSEDSDILWRIRKAGWKIKFNRNLKVYETDHRRLDAGMFKKFWHGGLRAFFLITGINKKSVQSSDWGYWDK